MSSTSPQRRSSLVALARGRANVEQVRLRVVPRLQLRSTAPRVPFVTLVSIVLLAGIVGLLLFNTSMQQASFDQTRLESQAANLTARRQALQRDLESLRDPQRLAVLATRQGMVPAASAAFIDLATRKVIGVPTAATAADRVPVPPLAGPAPVSLTPKPRYVRSPAVPQRPDTNTTRADKTAKSEKTNEADKSEKSDKTNKNRRETGAPSGDRAPTSNNESQRR